MAESRASFLPEQTTRALRRGTELGKLLFSRHWILPTCLILLGMAGLSQLGFWQLDRLEWRRGENERVRARLEAPSLNVNTLDSWDPETLHDRRAYAVGTFDYAHQVGIKNRFYKADPGIHLFTPLHLRTSDRVLMVNRGWIPLAAVPSDWSQFDEATGEVEIHGLLQKSQSLAPTATGGRLAAVPVDNLWYREDLTALQAHWGMELEPMFLLQETAGTLEGEWPRRAGKDFELTEGNHLSYAIQWYSFAAILGIGYVLLVRKRTQRPHTNAGESQRPRQT